MPEFSKWTDEYLISEEEKLDYRNPDLIGEILRRAEYYMEGITEEYYAACAESGPIVDQVFEKAVKILTQKPDGYT